ncbi:MAG: SIS domain-containing protein [candidate division Zixibacteria bacterium]|nr:SIS domain-containing protein [candidate division Zixibacteria bacterium]
MITEKTLIQSPAFEKKLNNHAFIDSYLEDMKEIIGKLSREKIDRIVELLFSAWKEGRTIFVMGNGGSASTATHFACDLAKCTIVEGKKRFRVICLNDNIPLMSALVNDNGFDNLFSEQLKNLMQEKDYLVAFSVHGGSGKDKAGLWSQNLLKAMVLAKEECKATLIGFSGFDGGAMKDVADECLVIPANSTPQVESFHLAMEHLITNCLRKKIEEYE